ncbi:MAG: hypothetical protein U0169_10205 [Polyangiaceae bacterium]
MSDVNAADMTALVYRARKEWTPAFGGAQWSLGIAWYTHLEEGKGREYFANVDASRVRVDIALPGLVAFVEGGLELLLDGRVEPRRGFAGPGVHVFPAGGPCAKDGGDVHFDTEGLTPAERASRVEAFTFVLMLQPAESGGGLRVWNERFDPDDPTPEAERGTGTPALVTYGPGDLLVLDSYRLHQIEPFGGTKDRISLTCHAVLADARWQIWF